MAQKHEKLNFIVTGYTHRWLKAFKTAKNYFLKSKIIFASGKRKEARYN